MSASSQPGSPTAVAMDGAAIAQRMIEATESAAAAAHAAAQALNNLGLGSANGAQGSEWYKVLPKPNVFDPKDREAELSGFRDWWWQVEQYIVAVDSNYGQDLLMIREKPDDEVPLVEQTPDRSKRSAFLYGLLGSLLKNRPLMLVKGVEQGNGLEATRQLFRTCQPSSRNRSLGMLQSIMQWPQFDMRNALLPQVLQLEDSFKEYERVAHALDEEIRFAVFMKCLGGQVKTYLQLTLQEGTTYDQLREASLRYDQSTIKWTQQTSLGNSSMSHGLAGNDPMDVDRVERGKGKSKGKGKQQKGKDKGKGKQKGKSSYDKGGSGKGYGNQQAQQQNQQSWNSKQNSWQQNANKGDSSGKGGKSGKSFGKGKDAGKGKSVVCHRCGGNGHFARDCRVRLVGQDDSSTAQSESCQDSQYKSSSSSANVNRVRFSPSEAFSHELNFDISRMNDFSNLSINMVSQQLSFDDARLAERETEFLHMHGSVGDFESAAIFHLHPLFQLDDMEHYNQMVYDAYDLYLYDVVECCSSRRFYKCRGEVNNMQVDSNDANNFCSSSFADVFTVRAVSACNSVDIILDSGSDVTLIPMHLAGVGTKACNQSDTYLRDAQGKQIATSDVRDVSFHFEL